jgi:hypothetical protein
MDKSQSLIGKSTINGPGPFSIAMLNYQRAADDQKNVGNNM